MERDKKVHDLAVAAAVAAYYNKGEIDKFPEDERIDIIASSVALYYEDCCKVIDKMVKG